MAHSSTQVRLLVPTPLPFGVTNDLMLKASQTPPQQSPDRSRVTVDGGAARHDNAFDVNGKVWMKNPDTGIFEWFMSVVEALYDANKPGWEYQVKDNLNKLYKEGTWVAEKELDPAS
ncbi:MAG: hypothetical protein Q9186_000930 [Xanthomendoza sp. 1 TL-2023]